MLDLRLTPWSYVHDTGAQATLEQVQSRREWAPVRVGRIWGLVRHPELRQGEVWVGPQVFVPADAQGDRITFFCTALGGSGNVYVGSRQVGQRG